MKLLTRLCRHTLVLAAVSAPAFASAANTLTTIDTPTLTGAAAVKSGTSAPGGSYQGYDTTGNLALGAAAVASSVIDGYAAIHSTSFLTDGYYGNGASWVAGWNSGPSWIKLDLGSTKSINSVIFGRDRLGYFNDRDPGSFSIAVATADNSFSMGNASNDGAEYATVFSSSAFGSTYNGSLSLNDSLQATFDAASARYIKISFNNSGFNGGVAVDEVQVYGVAPIPEPETYAMLLAGLGIMGTVARRRKQRSA